MSITFNGTSQCAFRAAVPNSAEYIMAGWYRRNSDSGANECWFAIDDGSSAQEQVLFVSSTDNVAGYSNSTNVMTSNVSGVATGTWYYFMLKQSGGTCTVRHCLDGDTAWQSNVTQSGAPITPDALTIGAARGNGATTQFAPMTSAMVKVWSGTLPSDADVLAERLATAATVETGLWARYAFADGALGTDGSTNARTLTLTASPTFTADKPTDLTISSEGGGGGGGGSTIRRLGFVRAARR